MDQFALQQEAEQQHYTIEDVPAVKKPGYLVFKRLFDVVVSAVAGIILAVPMVVIAALIHKETEGPVIFKQERLGKDGKPFIMYKFRTMHLDAEEDGPQWAEKNDVRCTKVGRILRKTRLDELPQIWNIFKGEMSFVGPRPEREYFYDQFETYIHGFHKRLAVHPGLTGWAQVNGGYELRPEEKIIFDMEYIQNQSFLLDMKCILMTAGLLFTEGGAR